MPLGIELHIRPLFLTSFFFLACLFETNSHFIVQAGLKCMALFFSFLSPEVITTTSTPSLDSNDNFHEKEAHGCLSVPSAIGS